MAILDCGNGVGWVLVSRSEEGPSERLPLGTSLHPSGLEANALVTSRRTSVEKEDEEVDVDFRLSIS